MEHQICSQLLFSFALLYVLCCQAVALPHLGTYSAMRLGNRVQFDGVKEPDRAQGPLKTEADIIDRNARHADGLFTSDYTKLLGQLSAQKYLESLIGKRVGGNLPTENEMPVKRHSDAAFTDMYSRLRKQMAMKKYLDSVLTGKRSQEELSPTNIRDKSEFLEPGFSQNYDDVTVDELDLLNNIPVNL